MKERRLPLGVDLGASRIRVTALSMRPGGELRLLGVGTSDVEGDCVASLRIALAALAVRERRCVVAVRASDAPIRCARLPRMSAMERARAARFEASTTIETAERLIVRTIALTDGRSLIAAAPAERVQSLVATARAAGLYPVAVDHEGLVQIRGMNDPVLDVGFERSTLSAWLGPAPVTRTIPGGGEAFTLALAHAYATSRATAEERKKTIGMAGAGGKALADFTGAIESALSELRANEGARIERLKLCGNGARLNGLREALENRVGLPVTNVLLSGMLETGVPTDVERASALDWFTSIAIASRNAGAPLRT